MECSNVISRYLMRPKQLADWCLADYVSKLSFCKSKVRKGEECEVNDDDLADDSNSRNDGLTSATFECCANSSVLIRRDCVDIRERNTPRIIRFVRYNYETDPENYSSEKLLLYPPWRNELLDLKKYDTYHQHLTKMRDIIAPKLSEHEKLVPFSTMLWKRPSTMTMIRSMKLPLAQNRHRRLTIMKLMLKRVNNTRCYNTAK